MKLESFMKFALSVAGFLLFAAPAVNGQYVYHDASAFPLLGKATQQTETRYERLPDSLKNKIRPVLWTLGKNTAGLAVRFRSNSTAIAARWELFANTNINYMTATGVKGLDLYCLLDGKWVFVNSGCPSGKVNEALLMSNMKPEEREYMLYLPLYDGVTSLEIGIDPGASIDQPQTGLPVREKPVVCYGTSILQGCSASRPGMVHTSILSRWLNREFINLGFGGNALLDYEIAEVIAGVDASVYILDFVPNASVGQMDEKAERFYRIIRSKHPNTPIIFAEDPQYSYMRFDQNVIEEVNQKNATIRRIVEELEKRGDRNIYMVSSEDILGKDGEDMVDGVHFTDLGFMRYAELLYPILKERLGSASPR